MNSRPQENGSANNVGSMKIEAYNSANDLIWNSTVDLTVSKTWEDWIVVPVEMAAISSLKFLSPRLLDRSYKFWPSIDNMRINEPAFGLSTQFAVSPVPIPAALWLFGSAIGLLGWIQRRKN